MRAVWALCSTVVWLAALAAAGCGGADKPTADGGTAGTASLACRAAMPFNGPPAHAAIPLSLFPPVGGAAVVVDAPMPASLSAVLDQQLADMLRKTGAPAITAAITVPGLGRWRSTQGLAQTQPAQPVHGGTEFYWGSVAKAVTAVLVLQLVEQGRLRLDDPVSRWFPQIPQAQHMTLAHLLTHTSGLPTHAAGASGLGLGTPVQQVALLFNGPLLFCPGTNASYSNAGYLLLALVVEAVEQQPLYRVVERRIAQPLGLLHLRALRPGEDAPVALATPHDGQTPQADPGAWTRVGAGSVVARAEDMVVFWQAVLAGRLLAPATVQSQWAVLRTAGTQNADAQQGLQWFGQGVMLIEWTDEGGRARNWLGHLGGIPTANAALLYDATADAHAAVAVNSAVSSVAAANALLKTVMDWRTQH